MKIRQKNSFWKLLILGCLIMVGSVFISPGCSNPPKTLDRSVAGPQVIVNPGSIRLGVAKLMDAIIVFEGSGFKPASDPMRPRRLWQRVRFNRMEHSKQSWVNLQ